MKSLIHAVSAAISRINLRSWTAYENDICEYQPEHGGWVRAWEPS